MLKQLKFLTKDYRKVWVLSDLHLRQTSGVVLRGRGFQTMEDHDNYIQDFWFKNITKDDLVIDIGDSNFQDPEAEFFNFFSIWPAKDHIYLWGNHYSGAKQAFLNSTQGREEYPWKVNNITFVGHYLEAKIDNQWIVFSHFPYAIFNNAAKGFISLCGHSHGTFPQTRVESESPKILDCGVENAIKYSGKPFFEWTEIVEIMKNKKHQTLDAHH